MKKTLLNILLPLFILFFTQISYAHDVSHLWRNYASYDESGTGLVYAHVANVRASPNSAAEVVGQLKAGDRVKVIELTEFEEQVGSMSAFWLKISYEEEGQIKQGYLWQGVLAFRWLTLEDGTQFVLGVEGVEREGDGWEIDAFVILKSVEDGKVTHHKGFNASTHSLDYANLNVSEISSLTNVEYEVTLSYGGGACGVPVVTAHFLWGKNLGIIRLATTWESGEGDGVTSNYYYGAQMIYPDGASNMILLLVGFEERSDEFSHFILEAKTVIYRWDGKKAILLQQEGESMIEEIAAHSVTMH